MRKAAPCSARAQQTACSHRPAHVDRESADARYIKALNVNGKVYTAPYLPESLALHGGHLRTMAALADIGAIVAPIVPAFYNRPKSVDDIVNHTCGRLLDLFGIDTGTVKRWKGGPAEE